MTNSKFTSAYPVDQLRDDIERVLQLASAEIHTLEHLARDDEGSARATEKATLALARLRPLLGRLPQILDAITRAHAYIEGLEHNILQEPLVAALATLSEAIGVDAEPLAPAAESVNYYSCSCGEEWERVCDGAGEDECPACHATVSPHTSEAPGDDPP